MSAPSDDEGGGGEMYQIARTTQRAKKQRTGPPRAGEEEPENFVDVDDIDCVEITTGSNNLGSTSLEIALRGEKLFTGVMPFVPTQAASEFKRAIAVASRGEQAVGFQIMKNSVKRVSQSLDARDGGTYEVICRRKTIKAKTNEELKDYMDHVGALIDPLRIPQPPDVNGLVVSKDPSYALGEFAMARVYLTHDQGYKMIPLSHDEMRAGNISELIKDAHALAILMPLTVDGEEITKLHMGSERASKSRTNPTDPYDKMRQRKHLQQPMFPFQGFHPTHTVPRHKGEIEWVLKCMSVVSIPIKHSTTGKEKCLQLFELGDEYVPIDPHEPSSDACRGVHPTACQLAASVANTDSSKEVLSYRRLFGEGTQSRDEKNPFVNSVETFWKDYAYRNKPWNAIAWFFPAASSVKLRPTRIIVEPQAPLAEARAEAAAAGPARADAAAAGPARADAGEGAPVAAPAGGGYDISKLSAARQKQWRDLEAYTARRKEQLFNMDASFPDHVQSNDDGTQDVEMPSREEIQRFLDDDNSEAEFMLAGKTYKLAFADIRSAFEEKIAVKQVNGWPDLTAFSTSLYRFSSDPSDYGVFKSDHCVKKGNHYIILIPTADLDLGASKAVKTGAAGASKPKKIVCFPPFDKFMTALVEHGRTVSFQETDGNTKVSLARISDDMIGMISPTLRIVPSKKQRFVAPHWYKYYAYDKDFLGKEPKIDYKESAQLMKNEAVRHGEDSVAGLLYNGFSKMYQAIGNSYSSEIQKSKDGQSYLTLDPYEAIPENLSITAKLEQIRSMTRRTTFSPAHIGVMHFLNLVKLDRKQFPQIGNKIYILSRLTQAVCYTLLHIVTKTIAKGLITNELPIEAALVEKHVTDMWETILFVTACCRYIYDLLVVKLKLIPENKAKEDFVIEDVADAELGKSLFEHAQNVARGFNPIFKRKEFETSSMVTEYAESSIIEDYAICGFLLTKRVPVEGGNKVTSAGIVDELVRMSPDEKQAAREAYHEYIKAMWSEYQGGKNIAMGQNADAAEKEQEGEGQAAAEKEQEGEEQADGSGEGEETEADGSGSEEDGE